MPDLSSVEAFRELLLNARSIAYVGAGTSGTFVDALAERLGIAQKLGARLRPGDMDECLNSVASGDAEIVLMPIPAIRAADDVALAGALPPGLQETIALSVGISSSCRRLEIARLVRDSLISSPFRTLLADRGFE